jgi:hypothetical protein
MTVRACGAPLQRRNVMKPNITVRPAGQLKRVFTTPAMCYNKV